MPDWHRPNDSWSDSSSSTRGSIHPTPPYSPASSSGSSFRSHFLHQSGPDSLVQRRCSASPEAGPTAEVTSTGPCIQVAGVLSPVLAFTDLHALQKSAESHADSCAAGPGAGDSDDVAGSPGGFVGHAFHPTVLRSTTTHAGAHPSSRSALQFRARLGLVVEAEEASEGQLELTFSSMRGDGCDVGSTDGGCSQLFSPGNRDPDMGDAAAGASDPPGITDETLTHTERGSVAHHTERLKEEGRSSVMGHCLLGHRSSASSASLVSTTSTDSIGIDDIVQQAAVFVGMPASYVPRCRSRSRTPRSPASGPSTGPDHSPTRSQRLPLTHAPLPISTSRTATPTDRPHPPVPDPPVESKPKSVPNPSGSHKPLSLWRCGMGRHDSGSDYPDAIMPVNGHTKDRGQSPCNFHTAPQPPALHCLSGVPCVAPIEEASAGPTVAEQPACAGAAGGASLPPVPTPERRVSSSHRPPRRKHHSAQTCCDGTDACSLRPDWMCLDCCRAYCDRCLEVAHLSPARRPHTRFEYRPQPITHQQAAHHPAPTTPLVGMTAAALEEALRAIQLQRRGVLATGREAHRAVMVAAASVRCASADAQRRETTAAVVQATHHRVSSLAMDALEQMSVQATSTAALVAARREACQAAEAVRSWRATEQEAQHTALRHRHQVEDLTRQVKALRQLTGPQCATPNQSRGPLLPSTAICAQLPML